MKKLNTKGFTLAELLIVVAIIAVLVAIAIPVFTKRLEASRETTDIANLRSAYATATVAVMSGKKDIKNTTMFFDPNSSTGLATSESDSTKIGRGTTMDGGADVATLANIISYGTSTGAAGKSIAITFDGTSISAGKVESIKFQ